MKRLPDSELEIMMAIWNTGDRVSRTDIEKNLNQENEWSPTTILSLLSRLEKKGFVKVEKEGKSNVYTSKISEEEYMNAESKTLLEKMYKNSIKNFMMALYADETPSKKELDDLQKYLDELKDQKN